MHGRGVTLLEVVVVVAIVSLLTAVALPNFFMLSRNRELRSAVRTLLVEIQRIRTFSANAKLDNIQQGTPSFVSLEQENQTYVESGLLITNNYTIQFFADTDTNPNNSGLRVIKTINFKERFPSSQLRIDVPTQGQQIRFRRNSTRTANSPGTIRLTSAVTGKSLEISISLAGLPRVR